MSTISAQFRNFREPTKDQLLRNFFSLPPLPAQTADDNVVDRAEMTVVRIL